MVKKQIAEGKFGRVYDACDIEATCDENKGQAVVIKFTQNHKLNTNEIEFLQTIEKNTNQA